MNIRIGILVSGEGTSLEALETRIQNGLLPGFEIAVAACNRPPGTVGVYQRSENVGVPCIYAPTTAEQVALFFDKKRSPPGGPTVIALRYNTATRRMPRHSTSFYQNSVNCRARR